MRVIVLEGVDFARNHPPTAFVCEGKLDLAVYGFLKILKGAIVTRRIISP